MYLLESCRALLHGYVGQFLDEIQEKQMVLRLLLRTILGASGSDSLLNFVREHAEKTWIGKLKTNLMAQSTCFGP